MMANGGIGVPTGTAVDKGLDEGLGVEIVALAA